MQKHKRLNFITAIILSLSFLLFLVGCKEEGEKVKEPVSLSKVVTETIHYDGEQLSFAPVVHADKYEIKYLNETKESDTCKFDVVLSQDVEFSIRALANSDNTSYKSCEEATKKSFVFKGKPVVTLNKENRTFSWEAINDSVGYKIYENDSSYQGLITETTYSFVTKKKDDGNSSVDFKVIPVFENETYFGNWSDMMSVTVLQVPTNLTYDGNILKWNNVNDATKYKVSLYHVDNGGKRTVKKTEELTANDFVFNAMGINDGVDNYLSGVESASFMISVSALSTKENVCNSDEGNFSFSYVNPINNVTTSEGKLVWEAIPNADYYAIEKDGVVLDERVYDTSYSIEGNGSYTIRVTPRREDGTLFSDWSARTTVEFIDTPYLTWEYDGVGSAYNLSWQNKKDGTPYNIEGCTFKVVIKDMYGNGDDLASYTYANKDEVVTSRGLLSGTELLSKIGSFKGGKYSVQVYATKGGGTNSALVTSKLSDPIYFYNVNDPSAYSTTSLEQFLDTLKINVYLNDAQIQGFFSNFNLGLLYRIGIDGTTFYNSDQAVSALTTREVTFEDDLSNTSRKYTVKIKVESENASKMLEDENHNKAVFILPSEEYKIDLERLTAPDLKLTNSIVNWDTISKASSYMIKIEEDGKDPIVKPVVGTSYNLGYLDAGSYRISVSAMGNGNIVLSSKYSNEKVFEKLVAPTNVKVEGLGEERKVVWDTVNGATSYEITIGTLRRSVSTNSTSIERSELSISGVPVSIIAVGNDDNNIISSSSSQIITLYKLETPRNVSVNDTQVTWSSVESVGGKNIGYNIYNGDVCLNGTDTPIRNTYYNLYDFDALKESYSLYSLNLSVEAVVINNDNANYYSSDRSSTYTINRLASPSNVSINQYDGTISWDESVIDPRSVNSYSVRIKYIERDETQVFYCTGNSIRPDFREYDNVNIEITVVAVGNEITTISSNPYNVSTLGEENKIGCKAKLVKIEKLGNINNLVTFGVDDNNFLIVHLNEANVDVSKVLGSAYGVSFGGVNNVIRRFFDDDNVYEQDPNNSNLYRYELLNNEYVIYNKETKVYDYHTNHSQDGIYDVKVRVEGGNYSKDLGLVSDDVVRYITSEYTSESVRAIILGQFREEEITLVHKNSKDYISFNNKANASKYEISISYLKMGGEATKTTEPTVKNRATEGANLVELDSTELAKEGVVCVKFSIRVLGDSDNNVFDSIKVLETVLILSNKK